MQTQKIIKTGNSLAVTIPSEIVKTFCLKVGDNVNVLRDYQNPQITLQFTGSHQLSFDSKLSVETTIVQNNLP